jgi:hypothetical protein
MDPSFYTHAVQWLGQQVVADPRFVASAVRTVFAGLTGHPPLDFPDDPTVTDFDSRLQAWEAQDAFLRATGDAFTKGNLNLKLVVKAVIESPYYRGISTTTDVPAAQAASLAQVGTGRILTPEMLNRKIVALTGVHWRKNYDWANQHDWLLEDMDILYGGIDSDTAAVRLTVPNGITAAVSWRMANEVACAVTAFDFSKPKASRQLFTGTELVEVPESAGNPVPGSVTDIQANIQALHQLLLGETLAANDPELARTYQLFLDTWHELSAAGDTSLPWACNATSDPTTGEKLPMAQQITDDKNYTIRSWMAVITYLLLDYKFLYE